MVAIAAVAATALLFSGAALAEPAADVSDADFFARSVLTTRGPRAGLQSRSLAARDDNCGTSWNGTQITGAAEGEACRWTVRYGNASRWDYPTAVSSQEGQNVTEFPPMCPQSDPLVSALGEDSPMKPSEDCLFMTVYAPKNATADSKLPVFVWLHGGGYVHGSASDAGLNGATIAPEDNMIVVFVQYRLGIFGFLPPKEATTASDPNFAVRDVVLALETVKANIAAVGGDPGRVTLGGQSAGASLSRTMMAVPAAKDLFHGLILQSDPINFGTQSFEVAAGLQDLMYKNATLNCTDIDCFKKLPMDKLLAVQDRVISVGPSNVTGVSLGEVFRPTFNTSTVTVDPINALFNDPSSLAINVSSMPLMLTMTRNESGYMLDDFVSSPQPFNPFLFNFTVNKLMGKERATALLGSGAYPGDSGPDGLRTTIEIVLTDAVWRCVSRAIVGKYAEHGGKAFHAEWHRGISYTFNQNATAYCQVPGAVCHSDDVYPTFSSAPNTTQNGTDLENQVHPLWAAFIRDGTPGGDWKQYPTNGSDADIFTLGNEYAISSCPAGLWGDKVKWDWQLFSNTTNGTAGASSSSPAGKDNKASGAAPGARLAGVAVAASVLVGAVAVLL